MSDELTVWLQGCLDDVEQVARAAGTCECGRCEPPLDWTIEGGKFISALGVNLGHTVAPGYINPEQAEHIVRNDPARILAEVESKRAIVELHERSTCQGHDRPWLPHGDACTYQCWGCHEDDYPCWTLRLLAQPYADRPGFKPEWAPDA